MVQVIHDNMKSLDRWWFYFYKYVKAALEREINSVLAQILTWQS